MASIFEQYGIKEVADITFYKVDTVGHQKPVLYIDSAKVSTIEKTASTTEARGGKANPALISWDFGTEITVTLEDALFSAKSLSIMQGSGAVITGTSEAPVVVDIMNEETSIDTEGKMILKHSPVDGSLYIYKIDSNDRWIDGQQLHGVTVSESGGTVTVTVATGDKPSSGKTKVVAFYKTEIKTNSAQKIVVNSDTFPGVYRVVGDTFARNRSTGQDEFFQFIIYRAKMQSDNTITLSAEGDPSTFNMSLKVLKNPAGSGMIELIKYNFATTGTVDSEDMEPSTATGPTGASGPTGG